MATRGRTLLLAAAWLLTATGAGLLGGVRIGEASAGVTAGRIGVLRIPTR